MKQKGKKVFSLAGSGGVEISGKGITKAYKRIRRLQEKYPRTNRIIFVLCLSLGVLGLLAVVFNQYLPAIFCIALAIIRIAFTIFSFWFQKRYPTIEKEVIEYKRL